jgi:CRP-like cAMP-binding protein
MLRRRGDAGQPFAVDTQELERKLRQVTEFQGLGERSIALLAKHARFQRHRAGERLWASGEDATQIAIVTGGLAKLVRPNLEGDPFNYGLFGPGDPIGVPALLDGRRYPTDAVAISQGLEVIRLDASILRQLARKEPAVGNALTALLLRFIDIMRSKIEILSAGFMPRRMQVLMLCLADRFGTWEGDRRVRIPLALTREQIAETIGVRLETVVRELKRWQRSGWIEISTSGYVVDRAVLLGGSAAPEFLDDQATSCRRSG